MVRGATGHPVEQLKFCATRSVADSKSDEVQSPVLLVLGGRELSLIDVGSWATLQTISFSAIYPTYALRTSLCASMSGPYCFTCCVQLTH
jgi:hypothetical protein